MPKQTKNSAPVTLVPNKGGRPRKLKADEETLKLVHGLGQIQATTKECAAFLEVSEPTFLKFRDENPSVRRAIEEGVGTGLVSLRRTQFRLAQTNAAMAIFLGKNYLGQKDLPEIVIQPAFESGPSLKGLTREELRDLARLLEKGIDIRPSEPVRCEQGPGRVEPLGLR